MKQWYCSLPQNIGRIHAGRIITVCSYLLLLASCLLLPAEH